MIGRPALVAAAALSVAACTTPLGSDRRPDADPFGPGVRLVPVAEGLDDPLLVTAPPGDPRLFVVEQRGVIRVMRDGALLASPFLDISDRVSFGGERGLLGLAFDPDFRANERFFVSYTDEDGHSVVASYQAVDRGDRADETSERVFLRVEQPFANHNGGHITFGPGGLLYVGLGDGGGAGDPGRHGQDPSTLLGAILRIDVSTQLDPPYVVPGDNPFVGRDGFRPEIFHYGLRNPWRFSFDRADGTLYIGDVGQNRWEEINAARSDRPGQNFGWNTLEGPECFAQTPCEADGTALPVAVYGHDDGCSVTGGHVYRGRELPDLDGRYLYADFCEGWIRAFTLTANGTATDPIELAVTKPGSVTSFGQDAQGELYVVTREGTVFRLAPS